MKSRLFNIVAFVMLLLLCGCFTGCMSTYRAQLEKKIPRVDAELIKVTGHTIYGVSGELTETGIKWTGTTKTIDSSISRVDSPLGSVTVEVRKAKLRP